MGQDYPTQAASAVPTVPMLAVTMALRRGIFDLPRGGAFLGLGEPAVVPEVKRRDLSFIEAQIALLEHFTAAIGELHGPSPRRDHQLDRLARLHPATGDAVDGEAPPHRRGVCDRQGGRRVSDAELSTAGGIDDHFPGAYNSAAALDADGSATDGDHDKAHAVGRHRAEGVVVAHEANGPGRVVVDLHHRFTEGLERQGVDLPRLDELGCQSALEAGSRPSVGGGESDLARGDLEACGGSGSKGHHVSGAAAIDGFEECCRTAVVVEAQDGRRARRDDPVSLAGFHLDALSQHHVPCEVLELYSVPALRRSEAGAVVGSHSADRACVDDDLEGLIKLVDDGDVASVVPGPAPLGAGDGGHKKGGGNGEGGGAADHRGSCGSWAPWAEGRLALSRAGCRGDGGHRGGIRAGTASGLARNFSGGGLGCGGSGSLPGIAWVDSRQSAKLPGLPMLVLLRLARTIDRMSAGLGRAVSWLTLVMVLIAAGNAAVRYTAPELSRSLGGNAALEAQWYLFAVVFLLAAPWTLERNAHVRVDVLYGRLSWRARAAIDLAGTVLFLIPFCVFAIVVGIPAVESSWAVWEQSPDPGGLPRYPIKTVPLVAFALLAIQGLSLGIHSAARLTGAEPPPPEEAP